MHPFSSQVLWSSLWLWVWTLSQVDDVSLLPLILLLGFYVIATSGMCSAAASCFLRCYLYFYVCGRLVTFLGPGEMALCLPYFFRDIYLIDAHLFLQVASNYGWFPQCHLFWAFSFLPWSQFLSFICTAFAFPCP